MERQELEGLLSRVAVALGERPNALRVDAQPFGKRWAVFIDCDHARHLAEVTVRADTEDNAYDFAWYELCVKLHAAADETEGRWRDYDRRAAAAEQRLTSLRKALDVEKSHPAGVFTSTPDGMAFVPGRAR